MPLGRCRCNSVFAGDRHARRSTYLRLFWKALPALVRAPPPDLLTWHEPHALPVCCAKTGVAAACWGSNVSAAPKIATAPANVEIAIAAGLKIFEICLCAIGHTLCCAVTRSHWHSANRGSAGYFVWVRRAVRLLLQGCSQF